MPSLTCLAHDVCLPYFSHKPFYSNLSYIPKASDPLATAYLEKSETLNLTHFEETQVSDERMIKRLDEVMSGERKFRALMQSDETRSHLLEQKLKLANSEYVGKKRDDKPEKEEANTNNIPSPVKSERKTGNRPFTSKPQRAIIGDADNAEIE